MEDYKEQENLYRLFYSVLHSVMDDEQHSSAAVSESADSLRKGIQSRPWKLSQDQFRPFDFNDPLTRCAYLKLYAGCHAALTRYVCLTLFDETSHFKELLSKRELLIASVGGGPGSDLAGFSSALSKQLKQAKDESSSVFLEELDLTVLDLMAGWSGVFSKVMESVFTGEYGALSCLREDLVARNHFEEWDLCGSQTSRTICTADVIIMTKVLSWIPVEKKMVILERLFSSMKPGAMFLYIDIEAEYVKRAASPLSMTELYYPCRRYIKSFLTSIPDAITHSSYEICLLKKLNL